MTTYLRDPSTGQVYRTTTEYEYKLRLSIATLESYADSVKEHMRSKKNSTLIHGLRYAEQLARQSADEFRKRLG